MMISRFIIKMINRYQKKGGGSRLLLVECNFNPTCSEYYKQALTKYGLTQASRMGLDRIHRCNNANATIIKNDPVV